MTTRAVIYTRISLASMGDTTKTDDQERICRELCAGRGWHVAAVFNDHSRSAWKRNRKRPGWDALLAAIRAGQVDVIVAYWGDRLVRQPRDLEDLLDLREVRNLRLVWGSGEYDFGDRTHRQMIRNMVNHACGESDAISDRKKAQYERWRREGRVRAGGYRAFGFKPDGVDHEPGEAAVVRELARRVLAGESLGSLVRELNARGMVTTAGNPWRHITLREMLLRPRYAGLMPDGASPAAWEPVLSREEWERVRAVIAARSAGSRAPGALPDNARKYLLSGLAECGADGCGAPMTIHLTRYGGTTPARAYMCRSCRGVNRSQPMLDTYVSQRVVSLLGQEANPAPRLPKAPGMARRYAALDAQRREIEEVLADPSRGSIPALLARLDKVNAALAELRERSAGDARARLRAAHAGITAAEFAALPLAVRRSLVSAYFRVVVLPASRLGRGFRTEDVRLIPRR